MRTRQDYEALEAQVLAPYACLSAHSFGREHPETEHDYRTAFQRDRDRVIHSTAFRRLEYKTQVFVIHEGDHYRTRLTHSLEGAQIARTIARALRLNEELTEAIILAHDIGHTPFGHAGQDIMNELMADYGGFEHNRQSLRIVSLLECRYPSFPGLNLSYEVREGIAKHATPYDTPQIKFEKKTKQSALEAQIVDAADEIAYNCHDLDDGIRSGLITIEQLQEVDLWRQNFKGTTADIRHADQIAVRQTVRAILNALVTDLVAMTEQNLAEQAIETIEQVRDAPKKLVHFSSTMTAHNKSLKKFLYNNLYKHYRVERMGEKAQRIIADLFRAYCKNPRILPSDCQHGLEQDSLQRVACDYIAGMTDRFAMEEHACLFDPSVKI